MFVRYISHEIRTPLNAVSMGLQFLKEDMVARKESEERMETIEEVQHSLSVSLEVLNDLLLYDKLEGGHLQLEFAEIPAYSFTKKTLKPFYLQVMCSVRT